MPRGGWAAKKYAQEQQLKIRGKCLRQRSSKTGRRQKHRPEKSVS